MRWTCRRCAGRLLGALRTAAGAQYASVPVLARAPQRTRVVAASGEEAPTHVVVIAASTGGPRALAEIVPMLEPSSAAIVIVQHMPPVFTLSLARRLDALAALPVDEAIRWRTPARRPRLRRPGWGAHHDRVARGGVAAGGVDRRAGARRRPRGRPALLQRREAFGERCVAVVLTGMGHDGALGARAVRERGGYLVVQDESTSIVYGMPQAALAAAGADAIAPLDRVAGAIHLGLRARGASVPLVAVCGG